MDSIGSLDFSPYYHAQKKLCFEKKPLLLISTVGELTRVSIKTKVDINVIFYAVIFVLFIKIEPLM